MRKQQIWIGIGRKVGERLREKREMEALAPKANTQA